MSPGFRFTLGLAGASLLALTATPAFAKPRACAALAGRTVAPGVTIATAQRVPASAAGTMRAKPDMPPVAAAIPAYCRVTGMLNRRTGPDGKVLGLGFEVALPENWNGRFLMQGGGGLNGTLYPALGPVAAGDTPALARGFAVASTDGGHTGPVFDSSFQKDQRAALDFAQRAVPEVTAAAKAIVAYRYGALPHHSYMTGCSTGGREGMMMAERYPEMFDGIVVGAPAMRTSVSNIALARIESAFIRAGGLDPSGKPQFGKLFDAGARKMVLAGLLKQCDGLDGLNDGVIENVAACRFKPTELACKPGESGGQCLAPPQVTALEAAYAPTNDRAGNLLYSAFPADTGNVYTGPGLGGLLPSGVPGPFGPRTLSPTYDVDGAWAGSLRNGVMMLTDTWAWTNLSSFVGHGGRMLMFHGVSDPWFSANDTLAWYGRVAEDTPGWKDASRIYMVPGMSHCSGGPNTFDTFDLLTPLVAMVEQDKAPGGITARRTRGTPAERPLCPWPSYPRWTGSGDGTRPQDFACSSS